MTLPQAWMQQAESELRTAQQVDQADARSRCQAISKYQQSVEKSVKAILDRFHTAGLISCGSDRRHKVARYVTILTCFPASKDSRDLLNQLQRLFNPAVVRQIQFLDSLVPEYPANGELARRNHEFPFQLSDVDWQAPSSSNAFTSGEIKRIRSCANVLIPRLRRILDALDLLYL